MAKFHFNNFMGVSAVMLLLLDGSQRMDVFSCVNSNIMQEKLYDLRIEFEVLKKVLNSVSLRISWGEVYKKLNSMYDLDSNGVLPKKDAIMNAKKLYYGYKTYLTGEGDYKEGVTKQLIENNKDFLGKYYEDVNELSKLNNEFVDVNGNTIELSDSAFDLFSLVYESKDIINSVLSDIDNNTGLSKSGYTGNTKVFGVRLLDIVGVRNLAGVNKTINRIYKNRLDACINDRSCYKEVLSDYTEDCNVIESLYSEENDNNSTDSGDLFSSALNFTNQLTKEELIRHLADKGIAPYEEIIKYHINLIDLLMKNKNINIMINKDINYINDLFKFVKVLGMFDKEFYEQLLGRKFTDKELSDVFIELGNVKVIGFTFHALDYFYDLVNQYNITSVDAKFKLDKNTNSSIVSNVDIMKQDIESKKYFLS